MDYVQIIISRYGKKGAIIDTNLLILYIVGLYNVDYIEGFKRIKDKGYTKEDFEALVRLLMLFKKVFLTSHVLAEFSNLTFNHKRFDKDFDEYLSSVIIALKNIVEEHVKKNEILTSSFFKFGFTDVSIMELAIKSGLPVITDDLPFYNLLSSRGISSINMNNIRMYK